MQNKTLQTHFYIILRFFDVLPNFHFIQIETMCYYYLQTWYSQNASQVAERFKTQDLGKVGNIRKVSKLHRIRA